MGILEVKELSIRAGGTDIVHSLSFTVDSGQRLAIVGESGSGKSMTALAILGLLPRGCSPCGSLLYDGQELLAMTERRMNALRGQKLVLIPQSGSDFMNPSIRVGSQMKETLHRLGMREKTAITKRSCELLRLVGFDEPDSVLNQYPFQLSGGMAQRVVMAMGMAGAAGLVIADEPTRGVDDATAATFMNNITDSFPGAAVIIITHNIAVARACEKLLVIRNGEMQEYGNTAEILDAPTHSYTRSLIDALPENGLRVTGHPCGRGKAGR